MNYASVAPISIATSSQSLAYCWRRGALLLFPHENAVEVMQYKSSRTREGNIYWSVFLRSSQYCLRELSTIQVFKNSTIMVAAHHFLPFYTQSRSAKYSSLYYISYLHLRPSRRRIPYSDISSPLLLVILSLNPQTTPGNNSQHRQNVPPPQQAIRTIHHPSPESHRNHHTETH